AGRREPKDKQCHHQLAQSCVSVPYWAQDGPVASRDHCRMLVSQAGMGKPYQRKDHYFRRAKQLGLRARSAFKIEEIADRFAILRWGARARALGAARGGFLQITAGAVGTRGRVRGIDLEPIPPLGQPQVKTAVLDVTAEDFIASVRA